MSATTDRLGQVVCGLGGIGLIASLFLSWSGSDEAAVNGWELWSAADIFLLVAGATAVVTAITGGWFGLFRPDLSLRGATDLLGVVSTVLLIWVVAFDFPSDASPEVGAFIALASAIAIMGGAGDYSTLRGAPAFPRISRS